MKTLSQLQVLIACPSDVALEKQVAREVIEKFNKVTGQALGVRCEPKDWENNSYPSIGEDGQSVLNKQIVEDADIFVGIMWSKVGSPTARAASGTIEEYEQVLAKWKSDPQAIEIMWYFKTDDIPQKLLVDSDFQSIQQLKGRLNEDGVYFSQVLGKEFRDKFEDHLTAAVTKYLARMRKKKGEDGTPLVINSSKLSSDLATKDTEAPRAEEIQLGVFDYVVSFEESVNLLERTSQTIVDSTEAFGNDLSSLAKSINNKDPNKIKPKEAKAFLDKGAQLIEAYSDTLEPNVNMLRSELHDMFTSMSGLFVSISDNPNMDDEALEAARSTLVGLEEGITSAESGISEMKQSLDGLPGFTYTMIVAKQRLSDLLDLLLNEFSSGRARIRSMISSGVVAKT